MKYRIHFLKFSAIAASACLLTGAVVQTSAAAAVVPTVVASAPKDQVSAVLPVESMVSSRIIAVLDAIQSGQGLLTSSAGHTLPDRSRQILSQDLASASTDLSRSASDIGALAAAAEKSGDFADPNKFAKFMAIELQNLNTSDADLATLTDASAAVRTSEAGRLTQLRDAARRAAAATYHETVWTSGFQAQIDACRGAVNLTAAYGVRVIGEEWECGGSRFPREGALVQLGGIMSGLYRVGPVVAVLDAYVARTGDIPRGYPLLYQTCRNGNAHTETFTELIPAG